MNLACKPRALEQLIFGSLGYSQEGVSFFFVALGDIIQSLLSILSFLATFLELLAGFRILRDFLFWTKYDLSIRSTKRNKVAMALKTNLLYVYWILVTLVQSPFSFANILFIFELIHRA